MTITAATLAGLYKPCANAACGQPVHRQAKACKLCGAPSPWLVAQAEVTQRTAPDELPKPAPATITSDKVVQLPTPAFETHFAIKDFSYLFGDVMGVFKQGQELTDFQTITRLKAAGMPILPKSEIRCPTCGQLRTGGKAT